MGFRYLFLQVSIATGTAIVAGAGAAVAAHLLDVSFDWQGQLLIALGAGLGGGLCAGIWAARQWSRRLRRLLEVSKGWLLGTLALRAGDRHQDQLGVLATQLDRLVEHLEADERDLAHLRSQSSRLSDQIRALAVDEERERLARELHDGVKQHLFSLSMTASALRASLVGCEELPPETVGMAQEVEMTATSVQRSLTRLIDNLRPAPLQEKGLAAALNDYTLLFGAREHILAYLNVQGNDALLPPSTAEALYRVAQEALHNVARHARATRVDVSCRCLSDRAILTVQDDGVGFDVDQAHRGLGLGNMQDRMMAVGGRLQIDSDPGLGTVVRAQVVLPGGVDLEPRQRIEDRLWPQSTIDNWSWLGQRLVIPVGQVWPWLPADCVHLRQPLVEPGSDLLRIDRLDGLLGLEKGYVLRREGYEALLAEIHQHRWGYEWTSGNVKWVLSRVRSPNDALRQVLLRNGQPLAAVQRRGRLLDTWTEYIYDDRGYCLAASQDGMTFTLTNGAGEVVLDAHCDGGPQIEIHRALPLPLLAMASVHIVQEMALLDVRV